MRLGGGAKLDGSRREEMGIASRWAPVFADEPRPRVEFTLFRMPKVPLSPCEEGEKVHISISHGSEVAVYRRTLSAGRQPPFLISLSLSIRQLAMGTWRFREV